VFHRLLLLFLFSQIERPFRYVLSRNETRSVSGNATTVLLKRYAIRKKRSTFCGWTHVRSLPRALFGQRCPREGACGGSYRVRMPLFVPAPLLQDRPPVWIGKSRQCPTGGEARVQTPSASGRAVIER
jgi:hypothetical protein